MFTINARRSDPETSKSAVRHISKRQHGILRIMENIANGFTSEEIARVMFVSRDMVSPSMPVLERNGLVKRSGFKRHVGTGYQTIWIDANCDFIALQGDKPMQEHKVKAGRKELVEALQMAAQAIEAELSADERNINNLLTTLNKIKEVLKNG